MPFTPFHFGPGVAFHAASPKRVSFLAFCATNVFVDFEPLYYMVTDQFPLHRFFHTYIGVSIVVVFTIAFYVRIRKYSFIPDLLSWRTLSLGQVITGAALGGYTHIMLDSIMHSDLRPFAPFCDSNSLLNVVSLDSLHWSCVVVGIFGVIVLAARKMLHPESKIK